MSIIATPSAADANSAGTLEEAIAYFANRLYTDVWDAADETTQEKSLLMAWQLIEDSWDWFGWRSARGQALSVPRSGLYQDCIPVLYTVIAPRIKEAQFEMALSLLKRDRTEESEFDGLGIASAQIATLKVQFAGSDADLGNLDPLPPIVVLKLREFGNPRFVGPNGIGFVPVERT